MDPPSPDLLARLRSTLSARPEVLESYLFGSLARGEARASHSDVDVAVYADRAAVPETPSGYRAELITELIGALGRNDVGVVVLNEAPPLLYHRVLRDGIRLTSRDLMVTTRREGMALSRYCDYVPQLAMIESVQRARIRAGLFGMSPGKVDRALVLRHLRSLEAAVRELAPHRHVTAAELLEAPVLAWGVEHGLQLCAQNVLDIATHLTSSAGRFADDYRGAIEQLASIGALDEEFARELAKLAGFRTVLVHAYLEVDLDRVVELLATRFDDFAEFARQIEAYLQRC